MKKTLALLLAVAFAVPAFAGNIFSNVETYGEIEVIGFTQSVNADQKAVANRVLFGTSMDLVEDVRANLTFNYFNGWGGLAGDNVNTYLNTIEVAEANVVVSNVFDALEVKVGRQFYGNEDSPVMYLGPKHNRYNLLGNVDSLDAALATYSNDSLAFSAMYGQLANNSAWRVTGLTLDYAFTNNLNAGIYWYDENVASEHKGVWGGKAAYQNEEAKLAVEYAKNYDNGVFSHNNRGWMLKADAAMNLDVEAMALTPRITYFHTEKGFQARGNYHPGLVLTYGIANSMVPGNDFRILNPGLDFSFKALEKVTFAFDYMAVKTDNNWYGNEFDLVATYQHNDYVSFNLGGGVATHIANDVKDIYVGQMGMTIKF